MKNWESNWSRQTGGHLSRQVGVTSYETRQGVKWSRPDWGDQIRKTVETKIHACGLSGGTPKSEQAIRTSMSNGSSNESSRSPVWRLEDWAEWVEFNGERWERAEAISNIKGNEAVECLMSVFLVATMVREEEEHGIEDYNRSMVVEDVAFVDVGEAFEWANEMLDDDFRVVEVSLKGQL